MNEEVIGVGCAFRTVVAAFERLRGIGTQESVVIQGCGPVGLYSTVLATEGGAGKVIVVGAPRNGWTLRNSGGRPYHRH